MASVTTSAGRIGGDSGGTIEACGECDAVVNLSVVDGECECSLWCSELEPSVSCSCSIFVCSLGSDASDSSVDDKNDVLICV